MIEIRRSPIHGVGAFTITLIPAGTTFDYPHPATRFKGYNHSCDPSARLSRKHTLALRDILAGEEITVGYGFEISGCRCPVCQRA